MNKRKLITNGISFSMAIFTLLIMFPIKVNFFTTLSTYSVQFVFLFLMLGMLFLVIDTRRLMFTALGCSAVLSAFLKNNSNANIIMPLINDGASISIAHINLANAENDVEAVTDIIYKVDADIFSLQEYNPFWNQSLRDVLSNKYKTSIQIVRIDPYGLGVFSNINFESVDTFYSKGIPGITAFLNQDDKEFNIIASYISPSLDRNSSEIANNQLQTINEVLNHERSPSIIVGDFNHVYWSNKIRTFRSRSQLLNSRRNVAPTTFSVPVDHIFHTSDLECTAFEELFDFRNRRLGILGRYQFGKLIDNSSLKAAYGYILR